MSMHVGDKSDHSKLESNSKQKNQGNCKKMRNTQKDGEHIKEMWGIMPNTPQGWNNLATK